MRPPPPSGPSAPPAGESGPPWPGSRKSAPFAPRSARPSWRATALVTVLLAIAGGLLSGPMGILFAMSMALAFARGAHRGPENPPDTAPQVNAPNHKGSPPPAGGKRKTTAAPRTDDAAGRHRHPWGSPSPDPGYALLGVSPQATPQEIRTAYRRLARRWHPDRLEKGSAAERARATERLVLLNGARERLLAVAESSLRAPSTR